MGKYLVGMVLLLFQTLIFYQGYLQMSTNYTKQSINTIVESHAQIARFKGQFTPEIKQSLEDNLKKLKKVDIDNVEYKLTETLVCTRNQFTPEQEITYEIIIPIKNVNSKLFSGADKDLLYPQRGSVTSEMKCGEI